MMEQVRLLVVEDNEDDYELTRELLSSKRVKITWTQSLVETIDALRGEEFDVILLDLGVSDSQGLSTFDSIIGSIDTPPAIIVFTGNDDDLLAQEAISRGAQELFSQGICNVRIVDALYEIRHGTAQDRVAVTKVQ